MAFPQYALVAIVTPSTIRRVRDEVRLYAAVVGLSRWAMIGFPLLWYKGTCNKTPRLKRRSSVMMITIALISIYEPVVSSGPCVYY